MADPPKAPVKTTLNRDYILRSALYFVDEHGLEALNIRALGKQMGVSGPAIYRHVPSKAALLDGIVELIWQSATDLDSIPQGMGWRQALEEVMLQVHRTLLSHPRALPLMATHPINTDQSFHMVSTWLNQLTAHGLKVDSDTIHLLNSLAGLTLGSAIAQASPPVGGAGGRTNTELAKKLAEDTQGFDDLKRLFDSPGNGISALMETSYRKGLHALIAGWPA